MATYTNDEIISLIDQAKSNRTETNNIEFKDGRAGLQKQIWKTISAFAHNPDGGVIVFGIYEDRDRNTIETVLLPDAALLQEQIAGFFSDGMVNAPRPDIRVLTYEGQTIIAVIVNEIPNENKPCFKKDLGLPNGACVRVGNTDRVISFEETSQFLRNSSAFKFDKTKALNTTLEMLSEEKIKEFLQKSAKRTGRTFNPTASLDTSLMKNLGIIGDFQDQLLPTVGGFLIFSEEYPQTISHFSRYVIRCVRYSGDNVASPIIDKADIGGALDEQIDMMQKFILRNIPLTAKIVGTKRVETYEYPEDAIRELVANAVVHRDYQATETYTQINIFSNRIEISNPGNLPPGITIENIKDSQFSRNEIIAAILKDMDYLEEYGRGIDIVFSRMAEAGLLEPIFKNVANSFKVTLLGEAFKELNERQVKIWQLIQEKGRITTKECVALFEDQISRASISNDISKLTELNLIKLVRSSNTTYYTPLH